MIHQSDNTPPQASAFGRAVSRHYGVDTVECLREAPSPGASVSVAHVAYEQPHLFVLAPLMQDDAYLLHVDIAPGGTRKFVTREASCQIGPAAPGAIHLHNLQEQTFGYICSPFEFMVFHFPRDSINAYADELGLRRVDSLSCPPGRVDTVLGHLCAAMRAAVRYPGDATALLIDHLSLALGLHLTRNYSSARAVRPPLRHKLSAAQVRRAKAFMLEQIGRDVTLAAVAAECQLSRSYFIQAFGQSVGQTPYAWLTDQRLLIAERMLMDPQRSIADVALACGFGDQSHLTRVFSRRKGMAPAAWRKAQRQ
ncbi:helix-turn-helix domain-containing protein [Polaromonas jejuensis]|uniref:Helix-turn-helix domain-containing protein n=1 Tax=Polaromonas jejuensis TaxID=457502 RepID=A0ABW0QAA8_9BURK|nr:AraC family transcriptional regulator [Polaromonas jejuensis]